MRLRKHIVLAIGIALTFTYILVCVYLFGTLDSLKRNVNRLVRDRGQIPEEMDLAHQMIKSECSCSESESKGSPSQTSSKSNIVYIQTVVPSKQTCDLVDHISAKQNVDIQVSEVYSHLQLYYHHLTFTHRGWIPDFQDITYSASQWSVEPLHIYIVPYSHQDPGWTSTVDRYYSDKTKKTLDLALKQLTSKTDLTFVWSEMIYLHQWYSELHQRYQEQFKRLLSSGRFEVVTGGWVMTDEAIAHYSAMLDQLMTGHQWLQNTFNYTVKTAWSLDAFGLSSTMPYFLSRSGIKNLLIQRVHYGLKKVLGNKRQLQFMWRQTWDVDGSTDVFTHLPPFRLYNTVHSCGPDPEICCQFDFVKKNCFNKGKYYQPDKITDSNIHDKSSLLLDQLRKKAQLFRHNHLLLLYGDDFRYYNTDEWDSLHDNLKKLMDYMNSRKEMNVKLRFSTLTGYLEAAQSALRLKADSVPTLSGDFLSYNDRDEQYWTGYYSSRPFLKHMTRVLYQRLRSADILSCLTISQTHGHSDRVALLLRHQLSDKLEEVRSVSGLLQHHDAITGTAKAIVVADYLERLKNALTLANEIAAKAVSFLLLENINYNLPFKMDSFTEISQQETAKSPLMQKLLKLKEKPSTVAVFNPLAQQRSVYVTVTVDQPYMVVQDASSSPLPCQVAPVWDSDHGISSHRFLVTFLTVLPPLGVTQYRLMSADRRHPQHCPLSKVKITSAIHHHDTSSVFDVSWQGVSDIIVETPLLQVNFCGCTGLLQGIVTKDNQIFHQSEVRFVTYGTGSWTNPLEDRSGAYTFIPNGPANNVPIHRPKIFTIEGPLLTEVMTILPMVTHKISMYNTTGPQGAALFVENVVDISAHNNTELAMRMVTDLASRDLFYTDINGFQMQRRQRLPQYKIQGNFYPMTSQAYIEDHLFRTSILSTSGHGVSSQKPGELEVMLDRRLNQDDWRGLNQGVLDNVPTTSNFVLLLETRHKAWKQLKSNELGHNSLLNHQMSLHINHPPVSFIQQRAAQVSSKSYEPLKTGLPCDVHLLNIHMLPSLTHDSKPESLLLLHRMSTDCDFVSVYDKCEVSDGKISMDVLFSELKVGKFQEMTLTGTGTTATQDQDNPHRDNPHQDNPHRVNLPLMEIKTFKLGFT